MLIYHIQKPVFRLIDTMIPLETIVLKDLLTLNMRSHAKTNDEVGAKIAGKLCLSVLM